MAQKLLFEVAQTTLPVKGLQSRFPVRRVFCVGQNYAEHAREMGAVPSQPFFFCKPADSVVSIDERNSITYPTQTKDFQYELELVVAIGREGKAIAAVDAHKLIYGYAVGIDLTRRDLQAAAKAKGHPWDAGKGFDDSAPCGTIIPMEGTILNKGKLELRVQGAVRQQGELSDMICGVSALLENLSKFYTLKPGDLVYTGTPKGVGPLVPGDHVLASVEGVGSIEFDVK